MKELGVFLKLKWRKKVEFINDSDSVAFCCTVGIIVMAIFAYGLTFMG